MMHATSESDMTSIRPSSASPRGYYVQSPSRDSQDDIDKCSSSNDRSTLNSPTAARHSLTSSSSTNAASRLSGNRRRWNKHYCNVVAEEGGAAAYHDDYYAERAYAGQCNSLIIGITIFGLLFSAIWLVAFGVSRNFKAQRLKIEKLDFGEGSDHTGVPTKFITVNCSAKLVIYNPATFFGIHVTSHIAHLKYLDLTVATGQLKKYYQPRKSTRVMWVEMVGREVPLYGAGAALAASDEGGGIPFKLEFRIQSRGSHLGKLVKMKHTTHFSCFPVITSKLTTQILFHRNSCKYL
ncbi:hypothetical protein C2S52_019052 [Perilla frutescens var. hirtella]|uniref:Late embryogenesis abundant protein LEA-2 subgroup domain-containing protein n=1 Tax=Perilla frutescens var. hirtella TaxID=608512 RepID=A0AAD4JA68_PERFH|nr:hypothetical protein C2S52_019052 [Perilla frutescens var. hirtella]KAH6803213.1 hypothetical protein C2S51_034659 [Perilla frutescens var. frutescens]KAH6806633.1 hypothetical protein C2S51_031464 [Perilla frutescens var. frutescens]KAH6829383.1 hypothetical protein C2S53_015730 [Perilla frutescens var. hirtella]